MSDNPQMLMKNLHKCDQKLITCKIQKFIIKLSTTEQSGYIVMDTEKSENVPKFCM